MTGAAEKPPLVDADGPSGPEPRLDTAAPAAEVPATFIATHEELFVPSPVSTCDACGATLREADESDGYDVPGHGAYLWARGDETRIESVPLCTACASAIGMTALARWEIEEEEG